MNSGGEVFLAAVELAGASRYSHQVTQTNSKYASMKSAFRLFAASIAAASLALSSPAIPRQANAIVPGVPTEEEAPIALLVDLSSGQSLFAREADRRFVPASITKTMTAFLAFEKMDKGQLHAKQAFAMNDATFRKWRGVGSTMYIGRGDRLTVDQLLHGITTVSANDASVVLGEGASGSLDKWLGEMNAKAHEIGMRDSHFGSPNGFPDEGKTWVTASDLVTLAEAMIRRHPTRFQHFVGHPEYEYGGIRQPNHDPLIGVVEGADGIKTGFTYQAGYGYLGTAVRNGRRLVMVIAGSDDPRLRNKAARNLMEWGFTAFRQLPLFRAGEVVGKAKVQDGSNLSVDLLAPHLIGVAASNGGAPKIELAIRYEGPLRAPIIKGERVADLIITVDGTPGSPIPLLAAEDVATAGSARRLINGIASIFL